MVEQNDELLTWELRELPKPWGEKLAAASCEESTVTAFPLANHRLAYLDFEGQISGNRGSVVQCDRGSYRLIAWDTDGMELVLNGGKLSGVVKLVRQENAWQLVVGK